MSFLYCTADRIGIETGGGSVTQQELLALTDFAAEKEDRVLKLDQSDFSFGPRTEAAVGYEEPWRSDRIAAQTLWLNYETGSAPTIPWPKLAHFYSGTFSTTIQKLKEKGSRVCYTCAAHDVEISRREHEALGIPYNFEHLNDPALFERYLAGYKMADVVVAPSTHSKEVLIRFGLTNRIDVIPHGVNIPDESKLKPFPKQFTVGFLASNCSAPDKGLKYLLLAWKQLKYEDAVLLIAGRDSASQVTAQLASYFGGGNIGLVGWVKDLENFYGSISLLCVPSATEGFNLEVLESTSHARPVLCSVGAGAADVVPAGWRFPSCDVDALANRIDEWKKRGDEVRGMGLQGRARAFAYDWKIIRQRYVNLWREILQ
jgi:glycosyltransferase involved in cell wall biosynthesis